MKSKSALYVLTILALVLTTLIPVQASEDTTVTIHMFYGETCPHCAEAKEYFTSIQDQKNIEIALYEVYSNKTNQELA